MQNSDARNSAFEQMIAWAEMRGARIHPGAASRHAGGLRAVPLDVAETHRTIIMTAAMIAIITATITPRCNGLLIM